MTTPDWVLAAVGVPYPVRLGMTTALCEVAFRVGTRGRGEPAASKRRAQAGIKTLAIVHSATVGTLASVALATHEELRRQTAAVVRFESLSPGTGLFVSESGAEWASLLTSVTVGFFVWELVHVRQWVSSSKLDLTTMIVHHIVSSILWPLSIRLEIAYFFLVHFEFTELSSPFLQLRWFVKVYGGSELLVSSVFALTFALVRTTLIVPMLRAVYLARPWDQAHYPHLSTLVRLISLGSLCIPFLLNALWTVQIAQMGLKTFRRARSSAAKSK